MKDNKNFFCLTSSSFYDFLFTMKWYWVEKMSFCPISLYLSVILHWNSYSYVSQLEHGFSEENRNEKQKFPTKTFIFIIIFIIQSIHSSQFRNIYLKTDKVKYLLTANQIHTHTSRYSHKQKSKLHNKHLILHPLSSFILTTFLQFL